MKKPTFLERLTGTGSNGDHGYFDDPKSTRITFEGNSDERTAHVTRSRNDDEPWQGEGEVGELAVDVYQTPEAIVVKAFIAGVQPQSLDISLTREMLTISGTRHDEREVDEEHYYQRELYWGAFSRTILLPEEVDVDMAEASERHGVLMIRLPKINKKRQTKLKVRSR